MKYVKYCKAIENRRHITRVSNAAKISNDDVGRVFLERCQATQTRNYQISS